MNLLAVRAIYMFEMSRTGRTLLQSIVSPVLSTSLYFVVFGAAIGSRISEIEGVRYGSFIVPGLIMMMLLTRAPPMRPSESISRASPARSTSPVGADLRARDRARYVGAAASKSIILGLIILATPPCSCRSASRIRSGWWSFCC